jgi:hypothetical protein
VLGRAGPLTWLTVTAVAPFSSRCGPPFTSFAAYPPSRSPLSENNPDARLSPVQPAQPEVVGQFGGLDVVRSVQLPVDLPLAVNGRLYARPGRPGSTGPSGRRPCPGNVRGFQSSSPAVYGLAFRPQ